MRKLLLGTTALAAAATLSTNVALADVSISGGYEFKYLSRGSLIASLDGTSMIHGDTDMTVNFTNKTDSGLDLTYRVDFDAFGTTETGSANIDEVSLSIKGGFGTIVLGRDDDASDSYVIDEMDLVAEEPTSTHASSSISQNSGISSADTMKVAYHLPAMGGLTTGISFADSGAAGGTDKTTYGLNYSLDAGGATVTLGFASNSTEAASVDTDETNLGLKVVSGDISMILSTGKYEGDDEDRDNTGVGVSFAMPNGMTLGAYTFKSTDDLDIGEEFTRSGAEVQYTIASGLTAMVNIDDYDYKVTAANHEATPTADNGTMTQLTIKASF